MLNKKELKAKYGDEKVYVIPHFMLSTIGNGFTPIEHDKRLWSKFDDIGHFVYRYDAEGESSMQQIIPYIVLYNKDTNRILATRRIQGDSRLQGKISIGVGGHINPEDAGREILFKAAVRELFEEVLLETHGNFRIIGYIRDITSSTNDHTGVVIVLEVSEDSTIREKETLEGLWMELPELINNYENLENWSKYVIDYFVEKNSSSLN